MIAIKRLDCIGLGSKNIHNLATFVLHSFNGLGVTVIRKFAYIHITLLQVANVTYISHYRPQMCKSLIVLLVFPGTVCRSSMFVPVGVGSYL